MADEFPIAGRTDENPASAIALPLLLAAVGGVDAELARITYALRDLAAWPSFDSPSLSLARAAIRRAFAHTRSVRELLVQPGDEFANEQRACALRARAVFVSLSLAALGSQDLSDGPGASFGTLEAFSAHVLGEVGRANTCWFGRDDDTSALIRAERAFSEIGRDPRVASTVMHGATSCDQVARLAWSTIGALLGITSGNLAGSLLAMTSCYREVG